MSKCGVQMLPVIWEGSREAIAHYVLGEIKNGGGFFYTHICTRYSQKVPGLAAYYIKLQNYLEFQNEKKKKKKKKKIKSKI